MSTHDRGGESGEVALQQGLPLVSLRREGDTVLVLPPSATTGEAPSCLAFEPFPLPKLPTSMSDGCAMMAELVWQGKGRCVGFVLLLDYRTRGWGIGIPRQRCSRDSACWQVLREDFPGAGPAALLAGSFQSILAPEETELLDAAPPHDGVHLIQHILPTHRKILALVTAAGHRRMADPGEVLFDDWEAVLRRNQERLTFV